MSLNKLQSRLIHASNTYPEWIKKVKLDEILRKGEIGFEELLDTLKISIDKATVADKIWAIKLTRDEGNIAILANFEKTDETGVNWLSSLEDPIDIDTVEFFYIPVEQDSLKWDGILVDDIFLGENTTILSTNDGYDVEIIFNDTIHPVEASSQNNKVVITEVTSYVRNDVNAEGVNAEYQHYQFINYRMKVGDGLRAYESLPYFGSVSISTGGGSTTGGTFTGIVYQSELQDFGGSDEELIASVTANTTPHNGDLFVINRRINDQYTLNDQVISAHVEKTAYSYNGSAWIALDGNYDARNVFFHEDITITKAFGIHTSVTSSKVLSAKGRSLYQFLAENLASEDKEVKKSAPKVSASTSAVYIKTTETTPTAQVTFTASTTDPSYEYGVKSGDGSIGTFSDFKVTYDGTTQDLTGKTYTITPAANATHGHTKSYTMSAAYTEGTEKPLTNLGNVIESQRYTSTTCTSTSAIYARYYDPAIVIYSPDKIESVDATELATAFETYKANTATLSHSDKKSYSAANQFNNYGPTYVTTSGSYKSMLIAIPSSYNKTITDIKDTSTNDVNSVLRGAKNVVTTINGVSYKVTVVVNADAVTTPLTIKY